MTSEAQAAPPAMQHDAAPSAGNTLRPAHRGRHNEVTNMARATHGNGEVLLLKKGEYEDKATIGVYRVLRAFNLAAVARQYHEEAPQSTVFPNDPDEKETSDVGFAEYLVKKGWLLEIRINDEIHCGSYSNFNVDDAIKASEDRIPTRAEDADDWSIGKHARCIVSPTPVPGIRGSNDTAYYGGHMVAECVAPQNLHLIAAAPKMRRSLQYLIDAIDSHGYLEEHPALNGARRSLAESLEQAPITLLNR
jgi:hypothetical protein